jgi:hypothetical protein
VGAVKPGLLPRALVLMFAGREPKPKFMQGLGDLGSFLRLRDQICCVGLVLSSSTSDGTPSLLLSMLDSGCSRKSCRSKCS